MTLVKKISAVLLAAAIMIPAAFTVNAASTALPDPTQTGSVTIHKYMTESGTSSNFDQGTGNEIQDDTIIDGSTTKLEDLSPASGVEFIITRLDSSLISDTNAADGITEKVTDKEILADLDSYIEKDIDGDAKWQKSGRTDDNGLLVFNEAGAFADPDSFDYSADNTLAQGYYLIEETLPDFTEAQLSRFIVRIPMTDQKDQDKWIYNVHVYPKNETGDGPEIDKTVTDDTSKHESAGLNDDIIWYIHSEIPLKIDHEYATYTIYDQLDTLLKLKTNEPQKSVVITSPSDGGGDVTLKYEEDYTLTYSSKKLVITMTQEGRDKMRAAYPDDLEDYDLASDGLKKLKVKITTVYDQDSFDSDVIENNLITAIYNPAELVYENESGTKFESEADPEPEVHYGGFRLLKYKKGDESTKLEGAKFRIYKSETDAKSGSDPLTTPFGTTVWEPVTVQGGELVFFGLAYGAGTNTAENGAESTDYWIVEVEAPEGYNLLDEPMKVTVNKDSHLKEEAHIVKVANSNGFELPKTGGIGTIIFVAAGIGLIAAAVILLASGKKQKTTK